MRRHTSASSTGIPVGIDLGTTFSAIAYVDRSGRPTTVPNRDGELTTASVVFFEDPAILVGREAAREALVEPENAAACFKTEMGKPQYSKPIRGEHIRPEQLSAIVLRKVKQDAEEKIGPITEAVITVPAYFDDGRRKATEDAAKIAGLNVLSIINEPSAAAMAYGYGLPASTDGGQTILVYDLGGGTFDVTLIRARGNCQFETLATDGDARLGGKDWDERIIDYVAGEFMRQAAVDPREDPAAYQELVLRCEEAKRSLSRRASVRIQCSHGGHRLAVELTQERFEDLTMDLLRRTQSTLESLLDQAEIPWDGVDTVLLTGGSTRMPMVREMVRKISGKEPNCTLSADEAVAHGAAIYAASLCARVDVTGTSYTPEAAERLSQGEHSAVNSHNLGVWVKDREGWDLNSVIIPRNSRVPCHESETYVVPKGGKLIRIRVIEGESADPKACAQVCNWIPFKRPQELRAGARITVTFSYSRTGRISVDALNNDTSERARMGVEHRAGMAPAEIDEATQQLETLQVI